MQIKHIAMLALVVAVSGGCSIWGPSYKQPDVNTPESWASTDSLSKVDKSVESADIAQLANMKWWEQFNDPVLNSLVTDALKNNQNIQQQIGSIIQAQGQLQQVEMSWIPTLAFAPGYKATGSYTGTPNASVSQQTIGNNVGYFLNFTPSYSINIMQLLRQQEAAEAGVGMAKYSKDAMRLTIMGQVAGSYLSLRGYDYLLVLQKQLVEDTAKQYELGQAQYKEGYISLLTLQTYQQQYDSAKAQVPIMQNNIVATRNAIKVLVNKNPGDLERGLDFDKIPMEGLIPVNLPGVVLKSRPDIMQAESGLLQANANIGVATSYFFPTLNLTGATGLASNGLNTLFNAGSDYWQAQVAASMPFLNLAQYGVINTAKGAYYTAYWNYINAVRTAFSQIDSGLSGHDKLSRSYKEQKSAYLATVTAYNLEDGRFKQGLDSYMPVLTNKIAMENAAITLASSKTNQLQTIVTLYQALAAGNNIDNSDKPNTKFGDRHDVDK